jgi:hypothetical protein
MLRREVGYLKDKKEKGVWDRRTKYWFVYILRTCQGGSLLWYWVPESPALRPLFTKYPLQKGNIECPLNYWHIIVHLRSKLYLAGIR